MEKRGPPLAAAETLAWRMWGARTSGEDLVDPRRALAYEKDVDVAIFAKNSAKSNDDGESRLCWRRKFGQGVRSCEEMYTTTC